MEHLWVTASDIRLQAVVIYNLNLSFKFVTINFTFSLLLVFMLTLGSMSPELLHRVVFQ